MLDSVVVLLDSCSTSFGVSSHFSSHRERSISFSKLVFDFRAISLLKLSPQGTLRFNEDYAESTKLTSWTD